MCWSGAQMRVGPPVHFKDQMRFDRCRAEPWTLFFGSQLPFMLFCLFPICTQSFQSILARRPEKIHRSHCPLCCWIACLLRSQLLLMLTVYKGCVCVLVSKHIDSFVGASLLHSGSRSQSSSTCRGSRWPKGLLSAGVPDPDSLQMWLGSLMLTVM